MDGGSRFRGDGKNEKNIKASKDRELWRIMATNDQKGHGI